MLITVIICAHNPRLSYITRVLESLRSQTLSLSAWELLLIDNASQTTLAQTLDLSWHPHGRHLREETLGLTAARLCGIAAAQNSILVFVDDDNVLAPDYLEHTVAILSQNPQIGAIGGKCIPEFEAPPPQWIDSFYTCLALRDLGDDVKIYFQQDQKEYPVFAPIGAGMVIRTEIAKNYATIVQQDRSRLALGRTGKNLVSGEDNDIILTLVEEGWGVGYFPQLKLTHLITARRITKDYLSKLNYASFKSWIQVLDTHGIRPWPKIPAWSVLPRKIKAYINYQAWQTPDGYIRWRGACGKFEGLARLS